MGFSNRITKGAIRLERRVTYPSWWPMSSSTAMGYTSVAAGHRWLEWLMMREAKNKIRLWKWIIALLHVCFHQHHICKEAFRVVSLRIITPVSNVLFVCRIVDRILENRPIFLLNFPLSYGFSRKCKILALQKRTLVQLQLHLALFHIWQLEQVMNTKRKQMCS